jgi:hypothetical protein
VKCETLLVTQCRNVSDAVRDERVGILLFQRVVYSLWVVTAFRCRHMKCTVSHRGDGRMTICACHSWETALKAGLDITFRNIPRNMGGCMHKNYGTPYRTLRSNFLFFHRPDTVQQCRGNITQTAISTCNDTNT